MQTEVSWNLILAAVLLPKLAAGCAPPSSDGAEEVTAQPVQLNTGVLAGPFGGPAAINEEECRFGVVCTRIVGTAETFDVPARGRLRELRIWSGNYIDAVQMLWQNPNDPLNLITSPKIGGAGGQLTTFNLGPDEAITAVAYRSGKFVDALYVETTKGRSARWGGGGGHNWMWMPIPEGDEVHGFRAVAWKYVHQFGVWSYLP